MTTTLTFKDGRKAVFTDGDSLELDLDGQTAAGMYSVVVTDNTGKIVFSAYHWHNDPKGEVW